MRKEISPVKKKILGAGFGCFMLLVWEGLSIRIADPFILPSPMQVIHSLIVNHAEIFTIHFPATMKVVAVGGLCSVILGLALAFVMDLSPKAAGIIYPLLTVTQTIPVICLAPVFVLWLGYTDYMRILVVVLMNFFTVAVDYYDGLQTAGTEQTELLDSFGAGRLGQYLYLRIPSALPNLFSALHVTVPWAVVGAAIAEWLGAPAGLGYYSRYCLTNLDAAGLLAPLFVLSGAALLLNAMVTAAEKCFCPSHR